jgi:hypothetical protein
MVANVVASKLMACKLKFSNATTNYLQSKHRGPATQNLISQPMALLVDFNKSSLS